MLNIKNHNFSETGFTLLEILIVIAIFTIMVGVSWGAFRALGPSWRLTAVVRDVVADIRYAQQRAVTEQVDYGVKFVTTTNEYSIIRYGNVNQVIRTKSLPQDIRFSAITGLTDNEVIFNPYGAVEEAGSVSLINNSGKVSTIEIRPSGFVKVD